MCQLAGKRNEVFIENTYVKNECYHRIKPNEEFGESVNTVLAEDKHPHQTGQILA